MRSIACALSRTWEASSQPIPPASSAIATIFYLVQADMLDVVRILHSRMDFMAHLANDDA
jgi:hypothetical protein